MSSINVYNGEAVGATKSVVPARFAVVALALTTLAVCVALALRVVAARGDLWLDEISTLKLVSSVTAYSDIFLRVPRDNNHFLNSAWLWSVGPDASVMMMRLPAIVLGGLSVFAAGIAAGRFNRVAGVIGAFLLAIGYFFVHYGSEARGYSGMIFAVLVAYDAQQAWLARREWTRPPLTFMAAICFGTFSHLTMVEASGALCLSAMAQIFGEPEKCPGSALRAAAVICGAAIVASTPAFACFLYGFFSPHFGVGNMDSFSFAALMQGLGGAAKSTLGLPAEWNDPFVLMLTAGFCFWMLTLVPRERRWFPAWAVFGLPLLHAAMTLPAQHYPRFHLTDAIGLMLLTSEGLGALWTRGKGERRLAAVLLGLICLGQIYNNYKFLSFGRGDYSDAVGWMNGKGPATYAIAEDGLPKETRIVLNFTKRRNGAPLTPVAPETWCDAPPQWLIVAAPPNDAERFVDRRTSGPADCPTTFVRDVVFEAWGLSGFSWALYRNVSHSPVLLNAGDEQKRS